MQKIICFDFDDVIVNNRFVFKVPLIGRRLRAFELGKQFMEGNLDPKKFNTFMGELMNQLRGVHIDTVMKLLLHMRLQKGAKELLEKLKKGNYKIVIVSVNDKDFIKKFLEKHNILQYVSHVYAAKFGLKNGVMTGKIYGDVIKTEKTGIIRLLENRYKVKLKDVIYVGDGLTDLPVIKKVGKGVLFNPNYLTRKEIRTNKILKRMKKSGNLFITEGNDLQCVLEFVYA